MSPAPRPITLEQIAALPPEFQVLLQAVIDHYEKRITALEAEVAALKKSPRNSSLPPSTEHPHAKPSAARKKSDKKRGGQPGHPKHERALIPVEECAEVVSIRPKTCRRCGVALRGSDPEPLRHQVWEIPEIKPLVSEYQLHRLTCPCCSTSTCGELPTGVPQSQAGPRLVALTALLMGCFKQSKRRVALFLEQVLNQPCSPGWVVKLQNQSTAALTPSYDELAGQLPAEPVLGIDESPTKEARLKSWLWTFVASTYTVFALRTTRAATVLQQLLTDAFVGVVNCDRAKMYWRVGRPQWCWAHLKRDFQALIDHPDHQVKRLGRDLMCPTRELFRHWQRCRDGTISRVPNCSTPFAKSTSVTSRPLKSSGRGGSTRDKASWDNSHAPMTPTRAMRSCWGMRTRRSGSFCVFSPTISLVKGVMNVMGSLFTPG